MPDLSNFDKLQLQKLQELYDSLSWEIQEEFKKNNSFIYVNFLDESLHEDDTPEEILENMLEKADVINQPDKHLIVFQQKDIKDDLYIREDNEYLTVDEIPFKDLLVIAKKRNYNYAIEQYKQKLKKGFCTASIYNFDETIAKTLLPDAFKIFKEKCDHRPGNLTDKEWDFVVDEVIWMLEILANGKQYEIEDTEGERLKKAQELFGKYLSSFWL
jgi:hypothetical protein